MTRRIWRPKRRKVTRRRKLYRAAFTYITKWGDKIKEVVMERKCDTQRGENGYEILVGKVEGMRELGSPESRWTADTVTYVKERRC